jgi:hypothetical protein
VDLADQLKSYYAVDIRCRYKYYLRVVFDSLDTTVVNGYLNYKSLNPDTKVTHLEFRQQVVHGLLGTYTSRKNTFPTGSIKRKAPPAVIHDHLPHIMPDRKRCKLCHKRGMENRSRFACVTCGAALCLQSDRNWFTLNRHSLNSMPWAVLMACMLLFNKFCNYYSKKTFHRWVFMFNTSKIRLFLISNKTIYFCNFHCVFNSFNEKGQILF